MSFIFIDIETDDSKGFGLDPYRSKVVTFQAMTTEKKPLILHEPKNLDSLKEKLENNVVVGHNIKFESKYLKLHFGVTLKNVYDTQIAENVISGGISPLVSLKELASKYCGVVLDKTLQCSFKDGENLTPAQVNYALQDIVYLPEIMQKQMVEVNRLNLVDVLEIEMKCLPAVAWLELSGVNVDLKKLKEIKEQVTTMKQKSKDILISALTRDETGPSVQHTFAGRPKVVPNLNSPVSLLGALKAKGYSKLIGTRKAELAKYQGDCLITELLIYRKNEKLMVGFINKLLGKYDEKEVFIPSSFINPVTGRVHADFNQYGALSGRFSCKNPNL